MIGFYQGALTLSVGHIQSHTGLGASVAVRFYTLSDTTTAASRASRAPRGWLDRLQRLMPEEPADYQDFFNLCIFTGARRSNVASMRIEAISLALALWRIPETKNGKPVVTPLVPPAIELIESRIDRLGGADSGWMFLQVPMGPVT